MRFFLHPTLRRLGLKLQTSSPSSSSSSSSLLLSTTSRAKTATTLARCMATTATETAKTDTPPTTKQTNKSTTSLYMWGQRGMNVIPETTTADTASSEDSKKLTIPTRVDYRAALSQAGHEIDENTTLKQICCGPTATAMVLMDGRCFVFGENTKGQLGVGHTNNVLEPTLLATTQSVDKIYLGPNFSAFVDTVGDLYSFGFGGSTFSGLGCLGHGDGESYLKPKRVESLVEDGCLVDDVVVGESHMAVLTRGTHGRRTRGQQQEEHGEVLTTGAGSYGRLGNLDTIDQLYLEPCEMLTNLNVVSLVGGTAFTLALTREGVIHGWGRNEKGQLGIGMGLAVDMYAMSELPQPIEADELVNRKIVKIAAGSSTSACISDRGELFIWGMGILEPELQRTLLHTKIVDVVCGKAFVIALDENGKMYSFGKGSSGVLGQGSRIKNLSEPALVEDLADQKIVSLSAGWTHVACLVEDADADMDTRSDATKE